MGKGQVDVIISQLAIDNIAKANTALEKTLQTILAVNKASRGGSGGSSPNDAEKINKANKATVESLTLSEKKRLEVLKLQKAREDAFDKFSKILQKEKELREKQVKSESALRERLITQRKKEEGAIDKTRKAHLRETEAIQKNKDALLKQKEASIKALKVSSNLGREYVKQSKRLNDLRNKYKDLALTEGTATKRTKALRIEIQKLDARLKKVDANVGQFQRSVGNYGKAMSGAVGAARRLAGAMGMVGGAFLIVAVIRDAAKRIKEFDKVMQNLSGILNVNRSELALLEKRIIDIAGSSVKTSNEVAKLAETLITLGKTKSEVLDLLEPINNLSIGLEATSQEAGELLITTLNAFGESSKAAQKYADIIAKMRTSTALDFERIKVSLGFLSPVAKAAGISFEKTGAILGVLVDNSIKASRAGRLMSSTFLRLAADGKTLEEGIKEITDAQKLNLTETELLAVAGKAFGTESAALGLILANNKDRVAELTKEFENAQGTLKELTDQQLESLDAKLKILDSSWEKLILSVEKGDGVFSRVFKGAIRLLTIFIDNMAAANKEPLTFEEKELRAFNEELIVSITRVEQLRKLNKFDQKSYIKELSSDLEFFTKKLEEARVKQNIVTGEGTELVALYSGKVRALAKLIKEESFDPLDPKGDGGKGTAEIAKKTIEFYQQIITSTKSLRDSTAETAAEYASYNKIIKDAEDGIIKLKNAYSGLIAVQSSAAPIVSRGGSPERGGARQRTDSAGDVVTPTAPSGGGQTSLQEGAGALNDILNSDVFIAAEETFFALVNLGDMLFERRIAHIDAEIAANEEKYNMLFLLAEGDEEQQRLLAIEKEKKEQDLLKKKRKEQKKQAIFNKAAAIIQIGINTAIAVTSQLSLPVAGFVLAALAAAAGAAAIATVIASPIPQFAKGGTMDHDGLAVVGDGGRKEVIKNPDGTIQVTPSTSTLVGLQKGAEIFPSIDAFNKEAPTDISDKIYSATVMASLAINNAEMKGYFDSKKIMDDKLLEAMLMNTEAIKKQKLRVNTSSQRIDLADELYKMRYTS